MKAGGTYPDIRQGVSSKEPQHRRPGHTTEQVNILSDPVRGLVRRRGTRYAAHKTLSLTPEIRAELRDMDVYDFTLEGTDYALLIRRKPSSATAANFAFLYNKDAEQFVPIVYENSEWVDDLIAGGASAVAAMGRYVYIAGNQTIPFVRQENVWDTEENLSKLAAWVRAGKFSSTYTITLTTALGTTVTASYTTPSATYPGTLDTSSIPFFELDGVTPRPDYQKDVNDAVNAYNSAVNEWITTSGQAITPEAVAAGLGAALTGAGVANTVYKSGILINDSDYEEIVIEDGGDNTTAYAVGRRISDATLVTKYHYDGKVVRVQPSGAGADEAYYLQARLDNASDGDYGAVSWFECPGVTAELEQFVAQLIVHDGTAYVAKDGAGLSALAPTSGDHPAYGARRAGDNLTSPVPWFVGKVITMLHPFQDRLLVGAENRVNASVSGDYLDFWRGSVVNIADSDPVEVFAHGSEGDVLRHAVLYNRSLVIFGDKQQYGIDGGSMLTPKSPVIAPVSANKDATDSRAVVSANDIFYAQYGDDGTSVHRLRVGALNGQATYTDALSDEVGNWLAGKPLQMVAITEPNLLLFRTDDENPVYMYRYADDKNTGQRTMEAWHKFMYAPALGTIIGLSSHKKQAVIFTARADRVVADHLSLQPELDQHGYMDSRVPYTSREDAGVPDADTVAVVKAGKPEFLMGTPTAGAEAFLGELEGLEESDLEVGVVSPGFVIPTNPFQRDQNGQAVLDGRTVLNRVRVDVKDTGGMLGAVRTHNGLTRVTNFEGRILGARGNLIGVQPIYSGELTVAIGREVRDCQYELYTVDWLPLNITGLAWVGQTFNNVRRVS